jgi:hypothetical protein
VASHYCPSSPCPICAAPLIEAALSNANRPFEPCPVPFPSTEAARALLAAAEACADSLESYICTQYGITPSPYPSENAKKELEMGPVRDLRAAVANMKETMR